MSIRQMIPMGATLRRCPVCGYPITAKGDVLTAHELECLRVVVPSQVLKGERK